MTDFTFKLALVIDDTIKNKGLIVKFAEWLNREYPEPSFNEFAQKFLLSILDAAQIPFDGSVSIKISHSAEIDYTSGWQHPKPDRDGKWLLDEIQLKNNSKISIKLEKQYIKGRVRLKGKEGWIIIEPENVKILISRDLFLRW